MTERSQQEEQIMLLFKKHTDLGPMHMAEMVLSGPTLPLANSDSAKEQMQKEALRELAVILTERVRQTASIARAIKDRERANRKIIVKRTLRHYGYPLGMQKHATDLVLCKSEMLAGEFSAG